MVTLHDNIEYSSHIGNTLHERQDIIDNIDELTKKIAPLESKRNMLLDSLRITFKLSRDEMILILAAHYKLSFVLEILQSAEKCIKTDGTLAIIGHAHTGKSYLISILNKLFYGKLDIVEYSPPTGDVVGTIMIEVIRYNWASYGSNKT